MPETKKSPGRRTVLSVAARSVVMDIRSSPSLSRGPNSREGGQERDLVQGAANGPAASWAVGTRGFDAGMPDGGESRNQRAPTAQPQTARREHHVIAYSVRAA